MDATMTLAEAVERETLDAGRTRGPGRICPAQAPTALTTVSTAPVCLGARCPYCAIFQASGLPVV